MAKMSELTFGTIVVVEGEEDAIVMGVTQTTVTVISEVRYDYPGGEGVFTGSTRTVHHDQVEVA